MKGQSKLRSDTSMLRPALDIHKNPEEQVVSKHPIGQLGQLEEIAEAVIWLSSVAAPFVTGDNMAVDGGYVAQ